METARNVLTALMEKNKFTINDFAARVGINKGTLSSAINGSRKISKSVILKTIKSDLLIDTEKEKLADCYFAQEYGEKALNSIKSFIALLNEQTDYENEEFIPMIPDLSGFGEDSEYEFLTGRTDIRKGITALLGHAIEKNQRVYTNYSFDDKSTDELVYGILMKSGDYSKFCHVVSFSEENDPSENLSTAFSLLKYMQIKVNAYYVLDSNMKKLTGVGLFPYYFVTNDKVFLYDEEFSSAIYSGKTDFVQNVFSKLKEQFSRYSTLCYFPENVLSQMDNLNTMTESENAVRFSPHVLSFLTKEDWESCISDKLEIKASLVDLAYSWYSGERGLKTINSTTTDGWLNFLKNGYIDVQPRILVNQLEVGLRRKLIERVIENLRAGVMTHRVINQKIRLPEKLIAEQMGSYIFFITTRNDNPETQWLGSAFFYLPAKIFGFDFKLLDKYLEINNYLYDSKESVRILENMLSHCQNDITINNVLL